jgi:hypothetical protein
MILIAIGYALYKYIDRDSEKMDDINTQDIFEKAPSYYSPI